ncbi:hypothetical protein PHLCEN_2v2265 [Hermanssonia centrifuga]|uniref:Uncharacterized protein n=1 Tax=Hermanssonia centrifuga TaxID=98765 RepID=A0A2R6RPK5_9APHY|nr:hypothetical protein PHLCEN_2v2265 [Hermanssonia centrifuga]
MSSVHSVRGSDPIRRGSPNLQQLVNAGPNYIAERADRTGLSRNLEFSLEVRSSNPGSEPNSGHTIPERYDAVSACFNGAGEAPLQRAGGLDFA